MGHGGRGKRAGTAPGDMLPGVLMRLVAEGMKADGFTVHFPAREDERRICIDRRGGRCDLLVSDSGLVEWECVPWASSAADPKLTADIAAFLLTGNDEDYPRQAAGGNPRGMPFRGIVGNELRARGFDVRLDVYQDGARFEVFADILATSPVHHLNASVRISDNGAIAWERDYCHEATAITGSPEYFPALADPGELADSIVTTVARAIALSSGTSAGSARRVKRQKLQLR